MSLPISNPVFTESVTCSFVSCAAVLYTTPRNTIKNKSRLNPLDLRIDFNPIFKLLTNF